MALVKADGTPFAKSPGSTVLEPQEETDPKVKVLETVYEVTPYDKVNYPTVERQLKFRAGQIIKQSEWDKSFTTPTIAAISPATGTTSGGTTVTITGTNFSQDAAVTFGGTAGTSVSVKSPTKLTVVTPAKTSGAVAVVVTTAGGSATKSNGFTYA